MSADKAHLSVAEDAVHEASVRSMNSPRQFATPCLMTALATAMVTPLSAIIRTPLANTIGRRRYHWQWHVGVACGCGMWEWLMGAKLT